MMGNLRGFIICVTTYFLLPLLFIQVRAEHPSLLFSSSQKAEIQARINKGGPVSQAFNAMKVLKTGDEDWDRSLAENSFHYAISGDETAKNNAIQILAERTSGEKRFSFPQLKDDGTYASGEGDMRYGHSMPCNSVAFAYDLLYPALSDGLKNDTKAVMEEWATGLSAFFEKGYWQGVAGNFYTGLGACVGNIGIALKGESSLAERWITKSKDALVTNYFNTAYNPGGDYEAGHNYQVYGAGPQYVFAAAYERIYGKDILTDKYVMHIWDFFTYAFMSNGRYAYYGDNCGNTMLLGEYFYILQKHKQKGNPKVPAWLWLWNKVRGTGIAQNDWRLFKEYDYIGIVLWYPQDVTPVNPNEIQEYASKQSNVFISSTTKTNVNPGGMATLRNGWTEKENITLWLVNRYRWQGHEHYDPNHFILSAYGEELISNKNGHTYDEDIRGQLSQQNSIMIDKHISDVPKYKKYSTGMGSSLGKFYDFFTGAVGDLLLSDSKYPHSDFTSQPRLQKQGVGTTFWDTSEEKVDPAVQADRVILFPKQFSLEPYYILYDRFNKDNNNHTYTWQSYLVPGYSSFTGTGVPNDPISFQKGNVSMQMFFVTPNEIVKNIIPASGKRADDLLEIKQTGVTEGRFLTILHPSKGSSTPFTVTVLNKENPMVVRIQSGINENIVIENISGSEQTYEGYTSDARLVILDKKGGIVSGAMVYRGKKVFISGNSILQSDQPVSVAFSWNGKQVRGAGVALTDAQTTISSIDGTSKTVSLKTTYSQFDETGEGGGKTNLNLIDYYYLVLKLNGSVIPSSVQLDFNHDAVVDVKDRDYFITLY